eukprot:scaffold103958_cov23-Tisochrysis_lutea.AAC.1
MHSRELGGTVPLNKEADVCLRHRLSAPASVRQECSAQVTNSAMHMCKQQGALCTRHIASSMSTACSAIGVDPYNSRQQKVTKHA